MRAYDLIEKKKNGLELDTAEIDFLLKGYVNESIPDYQFAAFLMAVYFKGMTDRETAAFTMAMARSGDMIDLSPLPGIKADKHSTGGVGDKTSLIVLPIAAVCGVTIAKMSGRGLGHTGGTVDKLESIPGYRTGLSKEEFFKIVGETGVSLIGQSGNICPADKKIYALRDVTATVDCTSLIASSIMSKKIAAGADVIVLDVKAGNGAFMSTTEQARNLAREMVGIGKGTGRKTAALITDMGKPLGKNIGNALEVIEACETLKNAGPKDLTELSVELAANMIFLAKRAESIGQARQMAKKAIESGSAFEKFREMVAAHGGDASYLDNTDKFDISPQEHVFTAPQEGYISAVDTKGLGSACVALGAGRETKESIIDHGAGIVMSKTVGDRVEKGEKIASLFAKSRGLCKEAEMMLSGAFTFSDDKPKERELIIERIE